MLKLIDEFQRVASTFKLDSNSVTDFDNWVSFKAAAKTAGRADNKVEEFNLFIEAKKLSDEAQDFISKKIEILSKEGKDAGQAAAIAYSMAREKGYDVPEPPKKGSVSKSAEPEDMEEGRGMLPEEGHEEEEHESPEEEAGEEALGDIDELAAEMFEKWEAGEMSLKEMHHGLLEQLGDSKKEEEAEDIIFAMIDAKIAELTGSDEEVEEEEAEEGD